MKFRVASLVVASLLINACATTRSPVCRAQPVQASPVVAHQRDPALFPLSERCATTRPPSGPVTSVTIRSENNVVYRVGMSLSDYAPQSQRSCYVVDAGDANVTVYFPEAVTTHGEIVVHEFITHEDGTVTVNYATIVPVERLEINGHAVYTRIMCNRAGLMDMVSCFHEVDDSVPQS